VRLDRVALGVAESLGQQAVKLVGRRALASDGTHGGTS
jgi:hypothetical protein